MIAKPTQFETLEPLTDYLSTLESVTANPTTEGVDHLLAADATLTDQTVLFARFNHLGRGQRERIGFESCGISEWVEIHARLALLEPGSDAFRAEYRRFFSNQPADEPIDPGMGTLERRRGSAAVALIVLGGKLALSGAFAKSDIQPAYEAIAESAEAISHGEPKIPAHVRRRIGRDLLSEYSYITVTNVMDDIAISKEDALENIQTAWDVVGRPFGPLTKTISYLRGVHHY